ncbi:hypothetical protein CNEO3_830028 [Clostridium neonatale]|nr:hypothetical protein CNEO3_830028 [Clostridium neonatale]
MIYSLLAFLCNNIKKYITIFWNCISNINISYYDINIIDIRSGNNGKNRFNFNKI